MPPRVLLLAAAVFLFAHEASADWVFTPFVGSGFGITTSQIILEPGTSKASQLTFGGSAAVLSQRILGAEVDFGYSPRFFERDNRAGNITGSNATTLSGSIIAAVPLSVVRESLRPYIVGGMGLVHAAATDAFGAFAFNDNNLGINVGGGAIGLISPRTGFRFEIRQFRTVKTGVNALTGVESSRLSFWRASVGVVLRIAK